MLMEMITEMEHIIVFLKRVSIGIKMLLIQMVKNYRSAMHFF